MQVSGQLQETVAISPDKGATIRMAEPQSRSRCFDEENFFCRYWKKKYKFPVDQPVA
jgi:hypothetical protein